MIRPRRALLLQLGLAALALVLPLGASLLVLTVPSGNAEPVILAVALVVIVGVLLTVLYLTSFVLVRPTGDLEVRFLGYRRRVAAGAVAHLLIVHVYQGLTLETQPRLFVLDADGRLLLRLDGPVYDLPSMHSLAADLDQPLTEQARVLTMAELRSTRRGILPWYERSRVLLVTALVVAAVLATAVALGLMSVAGIPIVVRP